ncbi:MAG: Gfo/Idh/MocA family oxidoreductase [Sedimentisphaerales bacterium]|nr:Gfo/Idh/MocA family oxidoreductase [Sedimentisphaerales bacterium]
MGQITRRRFLKSSLIATAGAYAGLASRGSLRAAESSAAEVRLAVLGVGGRGSGHMREFQDLPGVTVVAVCDPDQRRVDQNVADYKRRYEKSVDGYTDLRRVLDRDDVDAVSIASPNHWHSLMTVWACQAGKHVYCEKPVSHSIWEGRKMVEAARKYNRIVEAGTQQRSCPAVIEAAKDVQAERWGKVRWVHCSRLNSREPIGKVTEPQPVPASVDYNLWAGPAPMTPVMRKSFHYDWHWQWNWGDGEMANWGVHYLDDLRHILGWDDLPTKVVSAGNRFAWDDNGQTPNMHFALFEHGDVKVVVDIRNLPDPQRRGGREGAVYLGRRDGNYIQCENATVRISRGGGGAYDENGQRVHQYRGDSGAGHTQNFIDAVRSGRREDLNADIEVGHLSTAMAHQANAAWRAGAEASVDEVRESIKSHEDALNTLGDMLEQLEGNSVDLAKTPFVLGPQLTYDCRQEQFVGPNAEKGNKYLKYTYREGFVMPENV